MKAKHSVIGFFMLGLSLVLMALVGPAIAQNELYLLSSEPKDALDTPVAAGGEMEETMAPGATLPVASLRSAGVAFKPRESGVGWGYGGGGSVYASSGDTSVTWTTPVYLPQGSVVSYIRMYYYDTSANNCIGWLTLYDYDGDIADEWSVVSEGTGGKGYADSDPINHTINNGVYSYVLNWRPNQIGSTMRLTGFRIFYYPSGARYGSSMIISSPPP